MSIREKKTYLTSDGKEFTDRDEAEKHEKELNRLVERAKLNWLDRREYDLKQRLEALRRKNIVQRRRLRQTAVNVARFTCETDDISADEFRRWEKAADELRNLCSSIAASLEDIQKTETLLSRFHADRPRLVEEWKDVDGTCQTVSYLLPGHRCGRPTVEGTCWCANCIDAWCSLHGEHVIGEDQDSMGVYVYCPECENR